MATSKLEIEKFDGKCDFNLWKMKVQALLRNLGLNEAIIDTKKMTTTITSEILKKAKNTIILSLGDLRLRKVSRESSTSAIWKKLEEIYVVKSLPKKIYLKQKFVGFKMHEGKSIDENIDEFTKPILDLESLGVKIEDKDQAMILLNSLPKMFDQLRGTLKYSKDSLSLEGVVSEIHEKQMDMRAEGIDTTSGEGLVVRGRPEKRNNNQKGNHGRSKSKSKFRRKCFHCHKE